MSIHSSALCACRDVARSEAHRGDAGFVEVGRIHPCGHPFDPRRNAHFRARAEQAPHQRRLRGYLGAGACQGDRPGRRPSKAPPRRDGPATSRKSASTSSGRLAREGPPLQQELTGVRIDRLGRASPDGAGMEGPVAQQRTWAGRASRSRRVAVQRGQVQTAACRIASTPASGREPWAARPRKTASHPDKALVGRHHGQARGLADHRHVGPDTRPDQRVHPQAGVLLVGGEGHHQVRPLRPRGGGQSGRGGQERAIPPFMSHEPRPESRPSPQRGVERVHRHPSTPTVSRCPFRSRVGPVPSSRATTLRRPAATSTTSASSPHAESHPSAERSHLPLPGPPRSQDRVHRRDRSPAHGPMRRDPARRAARADVLVGVHASSGTDVLNFRRISRVNFTTYPEIRDLPPHGITRVKLRKPL